MLLIYQLWVVYMSSSDESSRHPWKQAAWRARQNIEDALNALPTGYPRSRTILVSEEHELLHNFLLQYHSILEPRRNEIEKESSSRDEDNDQIPGLWRQPLIEIDTPQADQRIDLSDDVRAQVLRNQNSDRKVLSEIYGSLQFRPRMIRLQELAIDWQVENSLTVKLEGWVENQGRVQRTITTPLHIPVGAAVIICRQLDQCLDVVGWLPEYTGPLPKDRISTVEGPT